jgi:hypothetical protein
MHYGRSPLSLMLAFFYFLSLKMEAVHSSEMLVKFYHTTWHHIPEDNVCEYLNFITVFSGSVVLKRK